MGVDKNIHFGESAEFRAEAERIAVEHTTAISKIVHAGALLDKVGQQYWLKDYEGAEETWTETFRLYKEARDGLKAAAESYIALEPQHEKSPKVEWVKLSGLDKAGGDIKANYSRVLVSLQRVMDWVNHILTLERIGPEALRKNEIKPIYAAMSEPSRELETAACEDLVSLIEVSRATHRISDLVETMRAMDRKAVVEKIPAA